MDKTIAFLLVNWFRLTDLAILTVFVTFVSVISLLFEELANRLDEDLSGDSAGFSATLDYWKGHHDTVCQLLEKIKSCFEFILLIQLSQIMTEMTINSSIIMIRIKLGYYFYYETQEDEGVQNYLTNIFMAYSHAFLRLLAIVVSSWILKNQVNHFNLN